MATRHPLSALAPIVVFAAACGAPLAPAAPDGDPPDAPCPMMGCIDGLTIELAPPGGQWAPGAYVFQVKSTEGTTSCEGSLPLPACDQGRALRCTGPTVSIGEVGCALPPDQHGFAGIDLPGGPLLVEISIQKDGQPLASAELDPDYRTESPNGLRCGPVCEQASGRVSW